jgi:hypothetical protein
LGILFSSILCTCPNQHNLCSNNTVMKQGKLGSLTLFNLLTPEFGI